MAKYAGATFDGFVEYHEARGREIPDTWDEQLVNSALLVASEWIDGTYEKSFVGYKTGGFDQERSWPRSSAITNTWDNHVIPSDVVPTQVINAVYEAAFRQATSPGSLLVDYTPGKYKKVAIEGALSVEYASFNFASDVQTTYPVIDQILADLLDANLSANFSAFSGSITRV